MRQVCRRAYDRGLVSGTGGNMSVRAGEDRILITASGVSLRDVKSSGVIAADLQGNVLRAGPGLRPSTETRLHLAFYRLRPSVSAVLHLHPPYTTAFATAAGAVPLVSVQAKLGLRHVPVVGAADPGSPELVSLTEQSALDNPGSRVFALAGHGVIVAAEDAWQAFHLADLAEEAAKTAFVMGELSRTR